MSKRGRELIPEQNGFVCFAIMAHGSNMYKDGKPMIFRLPPQVEEYNKITYCHYGGWNIMNDEDVSSILKSLKSMPAIHYTDPDKSILLNRLKSGIIPPPDVMLAESGSDSSEVRSALIMLKNQSQNLFQRYNYNAGDNTKLINKVYTRNYDDIDIQNIHVIFSESTELSIGEPILGSDKLRQFYRKKNPNVNVNVNEITTKELIDFAVSNGCSRVLILDFSCDVCKDYYTDSPVNRADVIQCRKKINEGKYARGGRYRIQKRTNKMSKTKNKQNSKRNSKRKSKKYF